MHDHANGAVRPHRLMPERLIVRCCTEWLCPPGAREPLRSRGMREPSQAGAFQLNVMPFGSTQMTLLTS
jgi:hypothetical protein